MHLFSTLHSGCNPPRVLSGCSRNRVIHSTYFCDCLGYTDTLTGYILKPITSGLRWTFLFVGCDIRLQPVQLLGCLDFPYDTNRNEGEGESILWVASETGKQNDELCIAGWAEAIFRTMKKCVQVLGQFLILKFAGLISPKEINFSFHFPSIGFSLKHLGAQAPLSSTLNGEEWAALQWLLSSPALQGLRAVLGGRALHLRSSVEGLMQNDIKPDCRD